MSDIELPPIRDGIKFEFTFDTDCYWSNEQRIGDLGIANVSYSPDIMVVLDKSSEVIVFEKNEIRSVNGENLLNEDADEFPIFYGIHLHMGYAPPLEIVCRVKLSQGVTLETVMDPYEEHEITYPHRLSAASHWLSRDWKVINSSNPNIDIGKSYNDLVAKLDQDKADNAKCLSEMKFYFSLPN